MVLNRKASMAPVGFFLIHSFISHSLLYISSKLLPNVRTKSLGEGKKTWLWIKHVVKAGAVACSTFLLVRSGWTLFYTPRHHGGASEEIQVRAVG